MLRFSISSGKAPPSIISTLIFLFNKAKIISYIVSVFTVVALFLVANNLLIDKLLENNNLSSNNNNEGMPFDINYYYRDEPNNYIKQNDELYRIIGITNSNYLKVIKIDSEEIDGYGTDGNINYFNSKNDDIVNGIFYVGYVRSETTDLSQIIKNEKRNNNYTKTVPKYYGSYSYSNVSDIINSFFLCLSSYEHYS